MLASPKDNVSDMRLVLDKVMIKRTAVSKDPSTNEVLVDLPSHETRVIKCSLTTAQRRIILEADEVIKDEAREAYARQYKEAKKAKKDTFKLSALNYFFRAGLLRAATVFPNILALAARYGLTLTNKETKDAKDCYGSGKQRLIIEELAGKEKNWLRYPENSIYQANLAKLTADAPKLQALKSLIDQLGTDIYRRKSSKSKSSAKWV